MTRVCASVCVCAHRGCVRYWLFGFLGVDCRLLVVAIMYFSTIGRPSTFLCGMVCIVDGQWFIGVCCQQIDKKSLSYLPQQPGSISARFLPERNRLMNPRH